MLVLSRRVGEKLVIGDNITVVVNKMAGNRVSLGIEAPGNVRIVRGELNSIVHSFDEEPAERRVLSPRSYSRPRAERVARHSSGTLSRSQPRGE